MTTINLSEFKEEHKVSLLLGSPPGYVGYGEGGILTEAVRRRPYSLVLLDEVEKAHPGVQDIFYQVFDKGILRDGQGRDINFKNTVIILTSNAGSNVITKLCAEAKTMPHMDALIAAVRPELLKVFKPAFLGRVTLVPYLALDRELMRQIVALQLQRIQQRVQANYQTQLTYEAAAINHIVERCQATETGARNIDYFLTRNVLPELSAEFLTAMAKGKKINAVHIKITKGGQLDYQLN
jgi:type VI secretion system protein VasG